MFFQGLGSSFATFTHLAVGDVSVLLFQCADTAFNVTNGHMDGFGDA